MARARSPLGRLSPAHFLDRHWQKTPLLVRGALPGFQSPLSPEELAGLACEEDVTSRLVMEQGGRRGWQVRHGPFCERDFTRLPEAGWTLLVHEVDRFVPEVGALLDAFRFIPNWRIDDVMVSYAPPGGSVGPHVDRYDVFLLQGLGRRRWRIARRALREERLIPDLELRVLARFAHDREWVLEPGDMLYLPPGIAHHGVALDPCLTFSIGFRAPDRAQMLAAYAATLLEHAAEPALLSDPELSVQKNPGEITPAAMARVRASLTGLVQGEESGLARWFGRFITTPARELGPDAPPRKPTPRALRRALAGGSELRPVSIARFAFVAEGAARRLYVGGEEYALDAELAFAAPLLTGRAPLTSDVLAPHLGKARFVQLLAELVGRGHLRLQPRSRDRRPRAPSPTRSPGPRRHASTRSGRRDSRSDRSAGR
jgi:50S ribosomal protein L16 3-hydroxylase